MTIIVESSHDVYDVVIVGGRLAGAALAARLGARGMSVLIVDKAEFPSTPEVPSCPVMHTGTIQLLEELGLPEADYHAAVTPIRTYVVGFDGHFESTFGFPMMYGRNYAYGLDRARFDHILWEHLARFPTVTRRAGFTVSELVRDDAGRVIGIVGAPRGGDRERHLARLAVVGADGRHSPLARRAGARVIEDRAEQTTTVHYAEWAGLAPVTPDGSPAIHIVATGRGRQVLCFPSRDGQVYVALQVRADRAVTGGDPQAYYLRQLNSLESVRRRLEGARQIGPLVGLRRIANRYREPGGPGWVLVGDALHHKDPLDGQGVYDALVGARLLADLLAEHHDGLTSWEALLARYQRAVMAETRGMFEATLSRLSRELFEEPPELVIRTLARWSLEDPAYQRQFARMLARVIPAERWQTPSLMAGVVARGIGRDLRGLLRRATSRGE
jgi:2-polyprenyl-6-methoxyphenol hydroxylase-like FAD-dependent oxidoreductase